MRWTNRQLEHQEYAPRRCANRRVPARIRANLRPPGSRYMRFPSSCVFWLLFRRRLSYPPDFTSVSDSFQTKLRRSHTRINRHWNEGGSALKLRFRSRSSIFVPSERESGPLGKILAKPLVRLAGTTVGRRLLLNRAALAVSLRRGFGYWREQTNSSEISWSFAISFRTATH